MKEQFQIITKSGDFHLVEIYENRGDGVLVLGEKRFDLNISTAFDLAEALYAAASGAIDCHFMESEDS